MNYWIFNAAPYSSDAESYTTRQIYDRRMHDKFWGLGTGTQNRRNVRFLTPSLGLDPPRVVQAAHARIAADGQPLLADHGHGISQPLTASVRCSRKSTPMDRLTTSRRDKASLSGPRCTRFQYQTGPSIPAHRRKCGLADCWESSACKFR